MRGRLLRFSCESLWCVLYKCVYCIRDFTLIWIYLAIWQCESVRCRSRSWFAVSGPDEQRSCSSACKPLLSATCPVSFTCAVGASAWRCVTRRWWLWSVWRCPPLHFFSEILSEVCYCYILWALSPALPARCCFYARLLTRKLTNCWSEVDVNCCECEP